MRLWKVITIFVLSGVLLSSCTDVHDQQKEPDVQTQTDAQEHEEPGSAEVQEDPAPDGASERAASTLATPETIVDGVILPEYYEFEYPDKFRAFMDACIEYSQQEDMESIAGLCGYGGTNQDTVQYIKQCCLDGIGMYGYSTLGGGWGRGSTRGNHKLWHYSFRYEGYGCTLYFLNGSGAKYEWIEFWLVPENGMGYAGFFYPGNSHYGDEQDFIVMNCEDGLFEGEFVDRKVSSDYTDEMQGAVKHGLLDGVCTTEGTCYRFENGRCMESWPSDDPSRVTDVDGYYLNRADLFYTVGMRLCRYEKSDGGMIWDPF